MSDSREYEQLPIPETRHRATLRVVAGSNAGHLIPLSPGTTTLGRETDNDIVLDEGAVSRQHAAIVEAEEGYFLRDLGSANGTFVNHQMTQEGQHLLRHGDLIRLGGSKVSFMFEHPGGKTIKLPREKSLADALVVDPKTRHVHVMGQRLDPPVSRKPFDLLLLLDSRRGEAVSRDDIARNVWPERASGDVSNQEIEQCVRRVRVRIEPDPSHPRLLVTVRGFGYRLN